MLTYADIKLFSVFSLLYCLPQTYQLHKVYCTPTSLRSGQFDFCCTTPIAQAYQGLFGSSNTFVVFVLMYGYISCQIADHSAVTDFPSQFFLSSNHTPLSLPNRSTTTIACLNVEYWRALLSKCLTDWCLQHQMEVHCRSSLRSATNSLGG